MSDQIYFRANKRNHKADIFNANEILRFTSGWTEDENKRFLSYIRHHWLVAPSNGPLDISFHEEDPSQYGQGQYVDKVGTQNYCLDVLFYYL